MIWFLYIRLHVSRHVSVYLLGNYWCTTSTSCHGNSIQGHVTTLYGLVAFNYKTIVITLYAVPFFSLCHPSIQNTHPAVGFILRIGLLLVTGRSESKSMKTQQCWEVKTKRKGNEMHHQRLFLCFCSYEKFSGCLTFPHAFLLRQCRTQERGERRGGGLIVIGMERENMKECAREAGWKERTHATALR